MTIIAILQARVSSTRLPGKVLKPILGRPMLLRQIERIRRTRRIDRLVVATSSEPADDAIETLCAGNAVDCFRGSLDDVLDRFYRAAGRYGPEHVVRLTGDCPLTDPAIIDAVIEFYLSGNLDYASNTVSPTFPDGLDVEVFRFDCLAQAWREAVLPSQREHVTPFLHQQPERFKIGNLVHAEDLSVLRWTVDEPEDFEFARSVYEKLYPVKPDFAMEDILALLEKYPNLRSINSAFERNEGLKKSLQADERFLTRGR